MNGFKKFHPTIFLRVPDPTSITRATAFNLENVGTFFNNLEDVMERFKFEAKYIYNADESGVMTGPKAVK